MEKMTHEEQKAIERLADILLAKGYETKTLNADGRQHEFDFFKKNTKGKLASIFSNSLVGNKTMVLGMRRHVAIGLGAFFVCAMSFLTVAQNYNKTADDNYRYVRASSARHIPEKMAIGLKEGLTSYEVIQRDKENFLAGY
ncbi:hypothetical protein [Burkholderia cenocepacia]|uniref:hypothetical protein n=1 Tax=Burkholderia cenocepacia TaxID=95486 RepID=UPI0026523792|nr:hypothetical protein [Burkholderia cenocepacia]MDN7678085.1 hypothetical protein [Burkholderia cenocepacia]